MTKRKNKNPFATVAKMGEIFCDKKEDQNKWKERMIKAGVPEGLSFPDDWEQLSEEEKEKRLNGVIEVMKNNK